MANYSVLIFSFVCVAYAVVAVRSQGVSVNERCSRIPTSPSSVLCSGEWPQQSITFPPDVLTIIFKDIVFRSDEAGNIQPLSDALTALKQLEFHSNVTSVNPAGVVLSTIPLQRLTGNVNRANIVTLLFLEVRLLGIPKQFLAGFTGLKVLTLRRSSIGSITADAFESLRTLTTNPGSGVVEARSVLRTLIVERNTQLKKFPWQVLTYVSSSLEEVEISGNTDLADITFTPIDSGNVTYPPMNRLQSVQITGNNYLSALPEAILTPGNGMGIVGPNMSFISFAGNGNRCEGCALKSLIEWAAELSDATVANPRNLWADCRVNCWVTLFGVVPFQAGYPNGPQGTSFWLEFQAQHSATCKPSVIKPCAAEFDATATTGRTVTVARQDSTPVAPTEGEPRPTVPSSTGRNPSGSRGLICQLLVLLTFLVSGVWTAT
ncbi:hypothetical protein BV898_12092 [Hypsibius exemplaris]|uniref:Uncharacterized protein n=1 Tax=Hypsibius exemplaris TaxID=2072580 RepID=A0A1W0WET6_HYPEX|nr:hypothetical protein BV898_12092 [Hypsibius exemplaris]